MKSVMKGIGDVAPTSKAWVQKNPRFLVCGYPQALLAKLDSYLASWASRALDAKNSVFLLGNIPDPLTISEKLTVRRRCHEIVFLLMHSAISRFIAALITGFVNGNAYDPQN